MELLHEQEFWFAIAFVVFIASVWSPARKALAGGLDGRAAKVRSTLDEAQKLRAEAQALLDLYRGKQEQAVRDAAEIIDAAREEAETLRRTAEENLNRALAAREAQAMDRISLAEQAALQSVRLRAVDIAITAATRLVADAIEGPGGDALIDRAIEDAPRKVRA
jgi:F-type H+-transporting ATPase subunit b